MSLLERNSPEKYSHEQIEQITSMPGKEAREAFALLADAEEKARKRTEKWSKMTKEEKADEWTLKMADKYEDVIARGNGVFEAHWNLDDVYHQDTFERFNDRIALSSEGMDSDWRLLSVENGIGLVGRSTIHEGSADSEAYQCVWYKATTLEQLGDFALRLDDLIQE